MPILASIASLTLILKIASSKMTAAGRSDKRERLNTLGSSVAIVLSAVLSAI